MVVNAVDTLMFESYKKFSTKDSDLKLTDEDIRDDCFY